MISALFSRVAILLFGTLYPAYASYKAVRTKNVKEYVKWMMYWIVFAFFTCIETITDIFLSWFPFYYEVKVIIVLWLLSPATRGSSTLYRKFVHPMLTKREQEIDEYINQAKERGYSTVLQLGSKGVNYATSVIMQTALKTLQFGFNTANNTNNQLEQEQQQQHQHHHQQQQPLLLLKTSHSDNTINTRSRSRDITDGGQVMLNNYWMARSQTVGAINEFSEDDEQMQIELAHEVIANDVAQDDPMDEFIEGAARIREPPARKTKAKRKTKKGAASDEEAKSIKMVVKTENNMAIRGRRKLRDATPDADINVE